MPCQSLDWPKHKKACSDMSLTLSSVVTRESGDTKLCTDSSDDIKDKVVKKNISEKNDLEFPLRVEGELERGAHLKDPDYVPSVSEEKVDDEVAYHPVPLEQKEVAIPRLVLILPIEEQEVNKPVSDARGGDKIVQSLSFRGIQGEVHPPSSQTRTSSQSRRPFSS